MEENYYALALAILKPLTPEQAFQKIYGITNQRNKCDLKQKDTEDMIIFRVQGLTYRQIGEMYNISADAVYTRIRRKTGRLKKSI